MLRALVSWFKFTLCNKEGAIEAITFALLEGFAGDLLYLYLVRVWYEPTLPILIFEMVVLTLTIPFAAWRFIRYTLRKWEAWKEIGEARRRPGRVEPIGILDKNMC